MKPKALMAKLLLAAAMAAAMAAHAVNVSYFDPTDADKPIKACEVYAPYTGQTTLDTGVREEGRRLGSHRRVVTSDETGDVRHET